MSESTEQLEQRLAAAEARLTVLEAGAGTSAAAGPNPWPAEAFDRHAEPPRRRTGRPRAERTPSAPVEPAEPAAEPAPARVERSPSGPIRRPTATEETPTGAIRRQRAEDPFYGR